MCKPHDFINNKKYKYNIKFEKLFFLISYIGGVPFKVDLMDFLHVLNFDTYELRYDTIIENQFSICIYGYTNNINLKILSLDYKFDFNNLKDLIPYLIKGIKANKIISLLETISEKEED